MKDGDGIRVKTGTSLSKDATAAANELADAIFDPGMALGIFYCSPEYDLAALGATLAKRFAGKPLIGCTTAGEITPIGYISGSLTGVSLTSPAISIAQTRIDGVRSFEFQRGDAAAQAALNHLKAMGKRPSRRNSFGFLLVDGLCMQEEALVTSIYRNMNEIQLFGGSAGDGGRFKNTFIYDDGVFRQDCAVFTLVHSELPFTVFKTEHFVSGQEKIVVTQADVPSRVVKEINGESAAREYARVVGVSEDTLTPAVFSAHPVVVKVGGNTYVRSIQRVNDDGSLTFFCAIDEGVVLTVASGLDLVENLEQLFTSIRDRIGQPKLILGCDCILRNIEAEQRGLKERIGKLMAANNVIGFSTYGEQFNAMHVNQTFTGVAIGG